MGDIIPFPRPERPEPEHPAATSDELAHLGRLLNSGTPEDEAYEIVALARRTRGLCDGD